MTLIFQQAAQPGEGSTAYDTVWAGAAPTRQQATVERAMLDNDKLFVVLAVVLLIWAGIAYFLLRTDRRLAALERSVESGVLAEKVER